MGRWAVERGFTLVSNRREKYPITKLECPLIERASIAAPNAADPALRIAAERR
jgi:LacI family transcriptional regulator